MEIQVTTGKKEYPALAIKLPLEYWETGESCPSGGLVRAVGERELLLDCGRDIHLGAELNVNVFFYDGHDVDTFDAVGKIVWKDLLSYRNMEGFQYKLEYTQVSDKDRRKIQGLLRGDFLTRSTSEGSGLLAPAPGKFRMNTPALVP